MEPHFRRALRVLRIVNEFHKRGYQNMRIAPGMAPSGAYWRCTITPRLNILRNHGAKLKDWDRLTAHYSSGQGNSYFEWTDAETDTVQDLADKFHRRMPEIVEASRGLDWEYAGWYVTMLGYAERGLFSIAYSDWMSEPDKRFMPLSGGESDLLMPPPGDAQMEPEE
jgi:hypothetical protein